MLINFRFKNCRSFLDENNLSLQAVNSNELRELNTFEVDEKLLPKRENELLKSAIIFGNTASGKSNVLKCLSYMRNALTLSASQIPIVAKNEPFAFLEGADKDESLYEVEIIQNNTYYQYGFCLQEGRVKEEWLNKRKDRRLTSVFKRVDTKLTIVGLPEKVSDLINVAPNTLFLSIGNNFHLDIASSLSDVMTWFQDLILVFENNANSLDIYTVDNGKYKEEALQILKLADIGIDDMNVIENIETKETSLETTVSFYDKNGNRIFPKNINIEKNAGFHSIGTKKLFFLLGTILFALDKGQVLFIDDFDSTLHYLIVTYLLNLFNAIDKNSHDAQLICTAHNIMLMDENLRRDQIYFTSKNSRGESHLSALSDYKGIRKNDLFSKKYLAGFYGAIPKNLYD